MNHPILFQKVNRHYIKWHSFIKPYIFRLDPRSQQHNIKLLIRKFIIRYVCFILQKNSHMRRHPSYKFLFGPFPTQIIITTSHWIYRFFNRILYFICCIKNPNNLVSTGYIKVVTLNNFFVRNRAMLKFNFRIPNTNVSPVLYSVLFYNYFTILFRKFFLPLQMPLAHVVTPIIHA